MESSDALVFFGATGNLAHKKIFPALAALVSRDQLNIPIIAVSRSGDTREQLLERVRNSLTEHGDFNQDTFDKLSGLIRQVDGDYADINTFRKLKDELKDAKRPIHYLAIPPSLFETVIDSLAEVGCAANARVIVEKPFGRDLASARELNAALHKAFDESSVFRIDHYLGKEAILGLSYFRFANTFLEPIWNRLYINSVQITMAEDFGVESRGAFYEEVGAIRDVVQNHMLQVLAMVAMEPPSGRGTEGLRDEKVKVLRAMPPILPADVVRGQYEGYRNETGVKPDSTTETFVALKAQVDTWRWSGVPFYIRAGKGLATTAMEVYVELRNPPTGVQLGQVGVMASNSLRFRLSPDVSISLSANVKAPGEEMAGREVELSFNDMPSADGLDPYERLLGDAIDGDTTLFTREDFVDEAWKVVANVLGDATAVHPYFRGSWGPEASDRLIGEGGWHNPNENDA
ncbi:MAG: glucose-6-phosphate dehydrogenase [Propionibacteriales bacterium]|nr:glucose-6-phosphate dehydrogenase [Propionibacteriales bacterium]